MLQLKQFRRVEELMIVKYLELKDLATIDRALKIT